MGRRLRMDVRARGIGVLLERRLLNRFLQVRNVVLEPKTGVLLLSSSFTAIAIP